jgi:predicted MFS family arabinose efflux permease
VDYFDYQSAFWVVLVLSSAGLILVGLKKTRESNPTQISYSPIQDARQAGSQLWDPKVLMILIFTFAIVFAANLRASFLPVLLRAEGLTELTVGVLIAIFSVTSTTIRLVFGRLMDTFSRTHILVSAMLAIMLAVGLIPSTASTTGFAILIAIFGLGFGLTQPMSMVMMADLTDPNHSGLSMGLRLTVIMVAGLLSPVCLGFIVETIGLAPAFYTAAMVVALAGVWMFILRPDLIPDRRL